MNRRHPDRRLAAHAGERCATGKGRPTRNSRQARRVENPEPPVVTRLFVCASLMAGGAARGVARKSRRELGFPRYYARTIIELEDGTTADAYLATMAGPEELLIQAMTGARTRRRSGEVVNTRLEIACTLQGLEPTRVGLRRASKIDWKVADVREHVRACLSPPQSGRRILREIHLTRQDAWVHRGCRSLSCGEVREDYICAQVDA